MGQVLHGSARTTEAVRRAIQHSQESLRSLAKRHGINPKTVAKWRGRSSVADQRTGPKDPRSTVLSTEEEAIIVAFRRHTLLPLDDCLYALRATIPHLTRSALHRCLTRETVTAKLAREIRDYYDAHRTSSPEADGPHAQTAITRTRLRAEKAGWLPPLAWDDDTIDDPNLPAPVHARRPAKSWQRIYVDDVAELAALGATWAELENRVGACRNSIEIALTRAGRSELIGRITSNRWVAA